MFVGQVHLKIIKTVLQPKQGSTVESLLTLAGTEQVMEKSTSTSGFVGTFLKLMAV